MKIQPDAFSEATRSRGRVTILSLLMILAMASPVLVRADEPAPETIIAENGRYSIHLTGPGEPWYDPKLGGRVKFTFSVIDKPDSRQYVVVLNNMTAKINRIAIYRDKLIVLGEESTLHSSITSLIDLATRKEADEFIGFETKLSETGRFMSFRKFYPPDTSPPETMSDLILIYDLDASADSNRMHGIDAYKRDPIGRLTEVGYPVFPDRNASRKNYRVWVRNEHRRNAVIPDGFFWFDGDRRFGFLDRVGGKYFIVVVDISNGPDSPVVREHRINLASLIGPEDQNGGPSIDEDEPIRLKNIEKTAGERIRIHLAAHVPLRNNPVEFSLDEMTPPPSAPEGEPDRAPHEYAVPGHSHNH